jgi:cation diffusion facilitator CzcD-associated flavoprotein CzcO
MYDKRAETGVRAGATTGLDAEVIVIGAGFSGIGAGIKLKEAGFSFLILEKAADLGGTWRDNTYPGIAVDITSFTYSFSFEQNPNWSRLFAPGRELQAYANHCVDKYGIRSAFRFGTEIEKAAYDEVGSTWQVHAKGGKVFRARYLIAATGGLTQPKLPDIPGINSFAGKMVHTARWDHGYDLSGKRVAVIGTGATAVQLVPSIAPVVKKLTVFQRTAIWILPKPDREIPGWMQWIFRYVPGAQNSVRQVTTFFTEIVMMLGIVYNKQTPQLIRALEGLCMRHLDEQVKDPAIREKLKPPYGFGCKRPSISNDYLRTFNRENVELETGRIREITPQAIVMQDGKEHIIDTLILSTGFKVYEKGNTPPFEVFGRGGVELGEFWDKNRYQAYEGASVPGFPNFFLIWGPYSASGSSWFAMIEANVHHALRCLKESRSRHARTIEVSRQAHENYFADIQKRQQNTVFYNQDCTRSNSYYFDRHGDAPFYRPSSGIEMWLRSRLFNLNHYEFR